MDDQLEFFDAFGFRPEFYEGIPQHVNVVNEKQVQSLSTQTCGQWTTFFVLQRYRGISMRRIVQDFNDLSTNDIVIAELFSNIFSTNIPVYI